MQIPPNDPRARAVYKVFSTPSGKLTVQEARPFIAPFVKMHLDDLTVFGRGLWALFVKVLDRRRRELGIEFVVEDIVALGGDVFQLSARLCQDPPNRYWPFQARFRVYDNRVVEIWSKRRNYVALFGDDFVSFWGCLRALRFCFYHRGSGSEER